ncbi:MAG: hypothetical protein RIC16_00965 [Rhodospirillales bacterium]
MTAVVFVLMVIGASENKPMFNTPFASFEACVERVEYLKARGIRKDFYCVPMQEQLES